MHILHLIKTSEGAAWALDLIRALRQKYDDITFSVVIPSGGKFFEKYFEVCENVYELSFEINTSVFKKRHILREIVKTEKPDIIHSWFTQTTLYARLILRDIKIPRLFEVVGPLHLESFLYRYFDIFSAQKQDYWKATSKYTYNKYLSLGVKQEKLFLNYIGVDVFEYLNNKNKAQIVDLRKKYNISSDKIILGTASYMYPPKLFRKAGVKNHEMLLQVFVRILLKRDDVILVVGGTTLGHDKQYELKLKKMANAISTDRIIFTGYVPNLGRLITEFDVFVFLSLSENLGGVFESLLFEVPTVASDRGGIPELVIDGLTGYTSNLKSIDEIVSKIEKLLADKHLAASLSKAGKEKVFEIFDKEKSIQKSYDIYTTIIQNK